MHRIPFNGWARDPYLMQRLHGAVIEADAADPTVM
jgi:hypothetical protein